MTEEVAMAESASAGNRQKRSFWTPRRRLVYLMLAGGWTFQIYGFAAVAKVFSQRPDLSASHPAYFLVPAVLSMVGLICLVGAAALVIGGVMMACRRDTLHSRQPPDTEDRRSMERRLILALSFGLFLAGVILARFLQANFVQGDDGMAYWQLAALGVNLVLFIWTLVLARSLRRP